MAGGRGDGDLTADGRIDISDFGVLKDNYGRTAGRVPEPAGWVLGAIGSLSIAVVARMGRQKNRRLASRS